MITDYASLQSAVTDFLARSDLSAAVTTFIGMGESRIYRDLRVSDMEAIAAPTVANASFAVPADYMEMRNLYVTDSTGAYLYELERSSPFWLRSQYQLQSSQGRPQYYAREAAKFVIGPYPDGSYPLSMLYYSRLPSLGTSNTTNWLTTKNPDLIFAAAMVEAGTYQLDAEAVQYWEARYQQVSQAVAKADKRERMSGSAPVMRAG
jgi:hypothetical protein